MTGSSIRFGDRVNIDARVLGFPGRMIEGGLVVEIREETVIVEGRTMNGKAVEWQVRPDDLRVVEAARR